MEPNSTATGCKAGKAVFSYRNVLDVASGYACGHFCTGGMHEMLL